MLVPKDPFHLCEHKYIARPLQTLNTNGTFEGHASLFNLIDLGRDLILPGAFKQTLNKNPASQIKMLWQHDAKTVLGHWIDIHEDGLGLYVKGQLNLKIAAAKEALALMEAGEIDVLSIGFRTIQCKRDQQTGVRYLSQIDLVEISIVTFPMMPKARIQRLMNASSHKSNPQDGSRLHWLTSARAFVDQMRSRSVPRT